MVKMIILLMLCLPLVLMLCLFTTTSVVSIAVDIPVGGIDIVSDDIVELDLDRGESFTVEYVIIPTEATNSSVSFSFEAIPGTKLAQFTVSGSTITPTSSGSAKVIVETQDGGYRDSFTVIVYTDTVESIYSYPENSVITVGETTSVITEFYPSANDESLTYRVKEGDDVVTVSAAGRIHGIGIGTAIIEVISVENPEARSELTVTVESSGVIDFASDTLYLTSLDICNDGTREIPAVLNPLVSVTDCRVRALDELGVELSSDIVAVAFDISAGVVTFKFNDTSYVGTVVAELTLTTADGDTVTKSCYVHCISEISVNWGEGTESSVDIDSTRSDGEAIAIDIKPLGADVSYEIALVYRSTTDTVGEVRSGVSFVMDEGHRYVCDGGYVSVELQSTASGVFLIVRGEHVPTLEEISSNATVTEIYLTVHDHSGGEDVVLEKISVVLY